MATSTIKAFRNGQTLMKSIGWGTSLTVEHGADKPHILVLVGNTDLFLVWNNASSMYAMQIYKLTGSAQVTITRNSASSITITRDGNSTITAIY